MTPERFLVCLERGMFPTHEAVDRLVYMVTEHDPTTFAGTIPVELLAELRERTRQIPKPEEFFILRSQNSLGPFDPVEHAASELAEKKQYVAGLEVWKTYFDAQKTQD